MMNRAGEGVLTGARRFSDVLRQRRKSAKGAAKLIQSAFGMEVKLRQYRDGEEFVKMVESTGGPELFNQVWNGPDWLPTLAEIRDPKLWVARVDSGATSVAR